MQNLINEYFNKINSKKFLKDDDEVIIGKAEDVINNLKQQVEYVKNPKNNIDEEEIEFIESETKELIEEIQNNYSNNDVIKIAIHPMAGFYVLQDKEDLYEDLKEYFEEECQNGN